MRAPTLRAAFVTDDELVVDNFAGGGGASTGIEAALGRPIDLAINHSPEAIAMHQANHPHTRHLCESVWKVDPVEVCGGRPVGLAWFSPDCTHHSRAKGGKPRSRKLRGLAWLVTRWAKAVRPRVILLENVEEFATWGPLLPDGQPCPRRVGKTFRAWMAKLRSYGYAVEYRSLVAADYGAPTTRRRLFLIARCDGERITWPVPTHGKGRTPWRTAAEVIDWTLPCPSIFDRTRPLAEATLRRIAVGVKRHVLETASPFLIPVTHPRDARVHSLNEPVRTITAAARGEFALVSPTLISMGYGEREGQAPRVPGLGKPLGTVVAGGRHHGLVAAFLTKHFGGVVGHGVQRPLGAITTRDHHALTTAALTPAGDHRANVRAFLTKYYGSDGDARSNQQSLFAPLHTVTTKARFGLVTVAGEDYEVADISMRMLAPHELFAAQGFPATYALTPLHAGKPLTKTAQIELAGNSVAPPVAQAIVSSLFRTAAREVA